MSEDQLNALRKKWRNIQGAKAMLLEFELNCTKQLRPLAVQFRKWLELQEKQVNQHANRLKGGQQ